MKTKIILFILFTVSALSVDAQYSDVELKGSVNDSKSNDIVFGAKITVKDKDITVVTDAEGQFVIRVKNEFPLTLLVSAPDYNATEYIVSDETIPLKIVLEKQLTLGEVVVVGRRRKEVVQDIPIPITVISGQSAEDAGAFNVNRLKELVPTVQLYSSNARNTTLNIRGLGSTFGLTNDGIDPGVGFYIDGVYHARPAATALDFIDVEQIEILRGPQGTLFGKKYNCWCIQYNE